MKLQCYYCGADVYRKRRIVAPACDGCEVQKRQEADRQRETRRKQIETDPKYREKIEKDRRQRWAKYDFADRSKTSRPRREWTEGEKQAIFESELSAPELAKKYQVSSSAIRQQRWKMGQRQSVLKHAKENGK